MLYVIMATLGLLLTIWVQPYDILIARQIPIPALRWFTIIFDCYLMTKSGLLIYWIWFQPDLASGFSIVTMFLCGLLTILNLYLHQK